jgi:hypothetical protein
MTKKEAKAMTKKEAKAIVVEVWSYLAQHPDIRYKADLPNYLFSKIEHCDNDCPFCDLFYVNNCVRCPLYAAGERCTYGGSAYWLWRYSARDDFATRARAAKRVAEIAAAWRPKEK